MSRKRLDLTERGEGVLSASHLLQMMADTVIMGAQMMDSGGPTWSYLAGVINTMNAAGLIEQKECSPPQPGSMPDEPPPFFYDAWRKDKKQEGGDAVSGSNE